MSLADPSPLHSSWPLWEQPRHFDLGLILNCAVADAIEPEGVGALGLQHAGLWECDLTNAYLVWRSVRYFRITAGHSRQPV